MFTFRNGDMFEYVLEYLRNGSQAIVVRKLNDELKKVLSLEANFYQLKVKIFIYVHINILIIKI